MDNRQPIIRAAWAPVSQMMMSDRLIRLAEEADRAGYTATAHTLIDLACSVFDEAPRMLN